MSCLWESSLTLKELFQASALGQNPEWGNAWLKGHVDSLSMQEAATMARIAAEQYRLVDTKSQQVSVVLRCKTVLSVCLHVQHKSCCTYHGCDMRSGQS